MDKARPSRVPRSPKPDLDTPCLRQPLYNLRPEFLLLSTSRTTVLSTSAPATSKWGTRQSGEESFVCLQSLAHRTSEDVCM